MTRLYTQDKNRQKVLAILDSHFSGYTVIPAIGCWRSKREQSLIIEVDGEPLREVRRAAKEIRLANRQEAVKLEIGRLAISEVITKRKRATSIRAKRVIRRVRIARLLSTTRLSISEASEIALTIVLATEIPNCDHFLGAAGAVVALLALALRILIPQQ
jgi:hypothetical protein